MEDHQPKEPKTAETAVSLHNGVLPPVVQTFKDQNQKNVRTRLIDVFDIIERDPLNPGNANGNAKQENKFDNADDKLRDFPLPHRNFDTEKSPKLLHSDLYINLQKHPLTDEYDQNMPEVLNPPLTDEYDQNMPEVLDPPLTDEYDQNMPEVLNPPLTDEYDQNMPEVFLTTKEITKPPKSKENEKLLFTPSETYEKMSIRKHGTNSPFYAGKNIVSSNNNNVPAAQQIAENHPTATEGQLEQISFRTPQNINPNFTVNSHGLQSPASAATPCSLTSPASSGGSSLKTAFQFKTPASVTFPWRNPATPFGLQTLKYASDLEQTDAAAISQKPDPLTPETSAPELFATSAYPETPVTPTVHELDFIKLNLLGKGAHGSVYKAKMGDGSLVAVKKMKNSYPRGHGETKDTALQTLNKEMHILKQVNHPNLVKYYGNFNSQTRDNPCIVLQLLDNDLVTILRSNTNPYNCAEIKCIMAQILSGLEFLHVRKIMHRDLKPENVLVGKNGKVKICDFGISRQAQDDDGGEYTLSVFPNSYRAPEIRAQTAYSTKADIWACGCLLCDIVFGRSLFTEKADVDIGSLTPVQTLASVYSILEGDPIQDAEDYIHRLKNGLPIGTQDTHFLQYVVDRDKKNHLLSNCGVDFLNQLLSRDPSQRLSATDALKHPWFSEEPLPVNRKQLPIYDRD